MPPWIPAQTGRQDIPLNAGFGPQSTGRGNQPQQATSFLFGNMGGGGGGGGVGGGGGGGGALDALVSQLQGQTGPTSTSQSTVTTNQNRSPELDATMNQFMETLNQLSGGFQTAYQGQQDSFDNLIRSLTNTLSTRESGAATAAASGALASGLTPLEAAGASQSASQNILQQLFPQQAQLTAAQANVPVQLQQALAGLQQNLNLPFISNVLSPYEQNVAGQVTTGTEEVTDTLARQGLLGSLLQSMMGQGSGISVGGTQFASQPSGAPALDTGGGYREIGQPPPLGGGYHEIGNITPPSQVLTNYNDYVDYNSSVLSGLYA